MFCIFYYLSHLWAFEPALWAKTLSPPALPCVPIFPQPDTCTIVWMGLCPHHPSILTSQNLLESQPMSLCLVLLSVNSVNFDLRSTAQMLIYPVSRVQVCNPQGTLAFTFVSSLLSTQHCPFLTASFTSSLLEWAHGPER